MNARSTRLCAASLVALVASCDPTPVPGRPPGAATSQSSGAERAASERAPQDPAAVRRGRELFDATCGACHGGESPRGGSLADKGLSATAMMGVLHAGSEYGGIMPAVDPRNLREEDLPALRAYLRSIRAER